MVKTKEETTTPTSNTTSDTNKNDRTYKELSKRELLQVISKENQRMKKKNAINKIIQKRLTYKKGKVSPRPTINVKEARRVQPEAYRSIFFRDRVHNQPTRSLFFI